MVDSPSAVVSPRETALGMLPAGAREALLANGQLAGLPASDPAWLLIAVQMKAQEAAPGAAELADRLSATALAAIARAGRIDTRAASARAAVAVAASICAAGGVGLLGGAGLLGHAAPLALLAARVPLWFLIFPPFAGVLVWGIVLRFTCS